MGPIGCVVNGPFGDFVDELNLLEIGERIREIRGKLTKIAFADLLGIERKTVSRYESGERPPDALTLFRLMTECGADPAWVLSGRGSAPTTTDDERELLALFKAAPLAVKAAAIGALQGGSTPAGKEPKPQKYSITQNFHGDVGEQAGRDIINKGRGK